MGFFCLASHSAALMFDYNHLLIIYILHYGSVSVFIFSLLGCYRISNICLKTPPVTLKGIKRSRKQ